MELHQKAEVANFHTNNAFLFEKGKINKIDLKKKIREILHA